MSTRPVADESRAEIASLRARLAEVEETLRAVRCGEVDALVADGVAGIQLFRLNALIEEMNEGAASLTAAGTVTYCNRRFGELVQAPIDRIVGRRLIDFIADDDHHRCDELLAATARGACAGDLRGQPESGLQRTLRFSLNRLPSDREVAISVIVTDQTEFRGEADGLRRVQEELQRRVEDRTSTLAAANRELANARLAAVNMMKDAVAFSEALKVSNEELRHEIVQRRTAEAEVRRLNEELEERVRRRTAQLEAANRDLEAFSYSVSHDLRAPLRALDGFSRLLIGSFEAELPARAKDYLDRIVRAAQRMSQLIDDLLALSRVTQQQLQTRWCDLSAIARTIFAELREADPDRSVVVELPDRMAAEGDPALLRILLDNLLRNAWKFTSRTEDARIEVGTLAASGQSTYFVRDNGVGFDAASADRLFVPFQRLHSATDFKGTGIGLAIAQRIVRRHGGSIWAESQLGSGAAFYFTLPERLCQ